MNVHIFSLGPKWIDKEDVNMGQKSLWPIFKIIEVFSSKNQYITGCLP